ncbi:hypothetical protein NONI108955_13945 [Nocardia ninae]
MQAEFDNVGYSLTASLTGSPGWWDCGARVGDGRRQVTTVLAGEVRWFGHGRSSCKDAAG